MKMCLGGGTHFIHGPYLSVNKGTYRITITYEAAGTSAFLFLYDEQASYDGIQSDEYYLDEGSNIFSTEFSIKEDLEKLECRIIYLGEGSLRITSMVLQETVSGARKSLFNAIIMVLAVQACYYLYFLYKTGVLQKKRYEILGLAFIWILSSYPLFTDYLYGPHDLMFHLKRIEGIKDGLLSGQFPVKIQPGWWSGAGYATGVYYPDAFLYFPAFLRILGFNVQEAFRIFLLLINGLTCIITYTCFNRLVNSVKVSLLGTLVYVTSIYRMTALYVRQAVGELTAMTFLPLVLYGFLLIIDAGAAKRRRPVWLPLVLGMTGVLSSHMLTSELTVLFMIILCIFFFKEILYKKRWPVFVKAAAVTLAANLWELVPFLDYFIKRNHTISMPSSGIDIQKSGTFLAQIFMSFPRFSMDSMSEYASDGIGTELPVGIGLPVFLLAGAAIWLVLDRNRRNNKSTVLAAKLTIAGFMAVLFSLHIFPWNRIGATCEIANKLVFVIQFLWRYSGYAVLFLCAGGMIAFASLCRDENKEKVCFVSAVITVTAVAMTLYYNDTVISETKLPQRVYTAEAVEYTQDKLYLPSGSNADLYMSTTQPFAAEAVEISDIHRNGMSMNLRVVNRSDEAEVVTIPFVYYEGYQAVSQDTHEQLEIVETEDKMVGVLVPEYYSGAVKVSFVEKWYWRLAELISLVTWILIIYGVYRRRRKRLS